MAMQEGINSLVDTATSLEDIHAACAALCRRYGFDQFLYVAKKNDVNDPQLSIINGGNEVAASLCSQGVLRLTRQENPTYKDIDHILASFPLEFKQEVMSFLLEPSFAQPLVSRLSFPIQSDEQLALLILSSSILDCQPDISASQLSQAREFALNIHQAVQRVVKEGEVTPEVKLTNREHECLQWAAAGKTNWEIGTILGVSKRTVIFHLQNAAGKLNTTNRYHTIAQALALGLIKAN